MSRILRRRRGYEISSHRDPRLAFVACLLYLPTRNPSRLFGAKLCRVRGERVAESHHALWSTDDDDEKVKTIEGQPKPNTALAFVNATGAHRASIPENAPADTERFVCQLQLGPAARTPPTTLENALSE